MSVLISTDIKEQIANEVKTCDANLQIVTAFCKLEGLQFLENNINHNLLEKKLMVRFRMEDIISGATDLSIYEYGKKNNWTIYIRFDLHAKTYIFDKKRCVMGSANLTNSGLQLSGNGNYEMANIFDIDSEDIRKIEILYANAIILDDGLYQKMRQELEAVERNSGKIYRWSEGIQKLFLPDFSTLFTYDFPEFQNYQEYINHSIDFLDLESTWDLYQLRNKFKTCKVFLWLKNLIIEEGGEMYFGEITANLHNVLINDPKPYRKEVKELLVRLLQWIQDLEIEDVVIDRPNHSQRVRVME